MSKTKATRFTRIGLLVDPQPMTLYRLRDACPDDAVSSLEVSQFEELRQVALHPSVADDHQMPAGAVGVLFTVAPSVVPRHLTAQTQLRAETVLVVVHRIAFLQCCQAGGLQALQPHDAH